MSAPDPQPHETSLSIGDLRLSQATRELWHRGEPVALSPTLFDALHYLALNPNRIVTKEELLDAVWPGKIVEEANVNHTIFALRKALAQSGAHEGMIVTAPRRGYRLVTPEAPAEANLPTQVPAAQTIDRAPAAKPALFSRLRLVGAAAVLAVAGLGGWAWHTHQANAAPSRVVLADFTNKTGDAVFDDSLQLVLRADLEQSPAITVLTRQRVADTLDLMTKPKTTPVVGALASEVCQRNNATATLSGGIARLGSAYLVSLQALNCAGDSVIADEEMQVGHRESVVPALDKMLEAVRAKLGESAASIKQFDVPLITNEKTGSLDALKAYSIGSDLEFHGQTKAAIPFFERAIALDPQFGAAYSYLAAEYSAFQMHDLVIKNQTKAHELRGQYSRNKYLIEETIYNELVTENYEVARKNAKMGTVFYPNYSGHWGNLCYDDIFLGNYAEAIVAGQRIVAESPNRSGAYGVLANAYRSAGQLKEADATWQAALNRGFADVMTYNGMFINAMAKRDQVSMSKLLATNATNPQAGGLLALAALDAYNNGRVRLGDMYAAQRATRGVVATDIDNLTSRRAWALAEFGALDRAKRLLTTVRPQIADMDYLLAMSEFGDTAAATRLQGADSNALPEATLWQYRTLPASRAYLALRKGQPTQAIAALEGARPYEMSNTDIPYVRGLAYLVAHDGVRAAVEFNKILANPGVTPEEVHHTLAQLGLARALRMQGNLPAARAAYAKFLDLWKNADPDVPVLLQAKAENAAIGGAVRH